MEADVLWFHPMFLYNKKKKKFKIWLLLCLPIISGKTWTYPSCRTSFSKCSSQYPLALHMGVRCQVTSFSVHSGCSNRYLSTLIQEFLKSLAPWVPEAFLYTFSFPIFALYWFHSKASQCLSLPRSHTNSVGGSSCQSPGLPISLTLLHPSWSWHALPYLKAESTFIQTLLIDWSLDFFSVLHT